MAAAYHALAERCGVESPAVAVRSSAAEEDGHTASFAGQHQTCLNVKGAENVLAAIRSCYASASSRRALAYRRCLGLSERRTRTAVLVQQLVVSDVSVVAFSADPVTGRQDEVVINASWGLGESLVGGRVTPDIYRVRKADMRVVSREVSDKRRMTVAIAGGTQEVDSSRGEVAVLDYRPT